MIWVIIDERNQVIELHRHRRNAIDAAKGMEFQTWVGASPSRPKEDIQRSIAVLSRNGIIPLAMIKRI